MLKFTAGNNEIISHSKTDSFGRKVFDELQLGARFVSRQFSYMPGSITDAHKENEKIKSTATTQLVSHIALSDGRAISYEYDNEERIIKVDDTIDGVVEYTYDALGQLETETKDSVTTKFEYDNYGNITAKGVVDENGEIVEATKISYVYGNDTWNDLLTSYNGQTIEYDAQGNPVSYLGHTLTWKKGRQLKKFDNIEYTYNANGIRTSKNINGVLHTYILDGTKILREVWGENTLVPLYDNEDGVCGILYNNVPYYFIKNFQGDIIAIVDKDAKTVARYSYDAWGAITNAVTYTELTKGIDFASINPFRYRSYYFDEEIGMYYLQSRYYDATVGRFISSDEVLSLNMDYSVISCNIYTYCNNDYTNATDISGFASVSGFLKHITNLFQNIANYISKAFTYLKNKFTLFKTEKSRWGNFLYISTALISLIIDLVLTLISKIVSLGLKGLVNLIKGLVNCFKNQAVKIIKNSILPFFEKSIVPFLKNFIKNLPQN